jgi:hypothetical protein
MVGLFGIGYVSSMEEDKQEKSKATDDPAFKDPQKP